MSTKRKIKTRIQNKHAIEADWIKAVNFIPLQGEIIVYDIEVDNDGNTLDLTGTGRTEPYIHERFKIGDGITKVNDLPFVSEDYAMPEMFGAIGDGIADDTDAIQLAINSGKPVKFMSKKYKISKTINVVGAGSFGYDGCYLDGNNCTITTITNEPIFLLTKCGNVLKNFNLTYDSTILNKNINPYTSSIIKILSQGKRITKDEQGNVLPVSDWEKLGNISGANRISNVNVFVSMWGQDATETLHTGSAFNITIVGHYSYSYQNIFDNCQAGNMHVAIELAKDVLEGETELGINANQFNIVSWSCDLYLKGTAGGSYFNGCVQSSHLKRDAEGNILNQYLIDENGLMNGNVFDNYFYDVAWDKAALETNQKIINIKGTNNTFNAYVPQRSVDGNFNKNSFKFSYSNNRSILLPTPGFNIGSTNTTSIMPFYNSLSSIINDDNHELEFYNVVGFRYTNVKNYGIKNLNTYLPTTVSYLFGENHRGRTLYLMPTAEDNYMSITIKDLVNFRLGNMFIYFAENPIKTVRSCTLEATLADDTTTFIDGTILEESRTLISFVNTSMSLFKQLKLTFVFGYDPEVEYNLYKLSSISGQAFDRYSGLIGPNIVNLIEKNEEINNSISENIVGINAVRINNLSPIEHDLIVKIRGKNFINLLNTPQAYYSELNSTFDFLEGNSIRITNNTDNIIDNNNYGFIVKNKKEWAGKTITVSAKPPVKTDANGNIIELGYIPYYIVVGRTNKTEGVISSAVNAICAYTTNENNYLTFTVDDKFYLNNFYITFASGSLNPGESVYIENIMVEVNNKPGTYAEPIADITSVKINKYKKNLIKYTDVIVEGNWIANGDNGFLYLLNDLRFQNAVFKVFNAGGNIEGDKLNFVYSLDDGNTWNIEDSPYKVIDGKETNVQFIAGIEGAKYALWINSYSVLTPIYRMNLELGEILTGSDIYSEPVVYQSDENGNLIGINNEINPVISLISDTDNVIIDVQYLTTNYLEINNNITVAKAIADAEGNIISETYATKEELGGASGGIASSAEKLETPRRISLTKAVETEGIEFDGTADKEIEISKVYESYVDWDKEIHCNAELTPIDVALKDSANILAFMPANLITIEYSREVGENGESIWLDYGATDEEKINFVTKNQNFWLGKYVDGDTFTTDYKLRVTINTNRYQLYGYIRKILVRLSSQSTLKLEYSLNSNPETFISYPDNNQLYGVENWISLSYPDNLLLGGASNNNVNALRYTFYAQTTTNHPIVSGLRLFGYHTFSANSNLAMTGHLYDYDAYQNAIFPASVSATSFKENGTNLSDIYASKEELETRIKEESFDELSLTVSGENKVSLENVSEVEHELDVVINGGGVDLSTVNITRYGKNLLNMNQAWGLNSTGSYRTINIPFPSDIITISYARKEIKKYYVIMKSNNNWATRTNVAYLGTDSKDLTGKKTITKEEGYEYQVWTNEKDNFDENGVLLPENNLIYLQAEIGDTATDYEPYIEPITSTANADGKVYGLTSSYPTTLLLSDTNGIIINVNYLTNNYTKVIDNHIENKIDNFNQLTAPEHFSAITLGSSNWSNSSELIGDKYTFVNTINYSIDKYINLDNDSIDNYTIIFDLSENATLAQRKAAENACLYGYWLDCLDNSKGGNIWRFAFVIGCTSDIAPIIDIPIDAVVIK